VVVWAAMIIGIIVLVDAREVYDFIVRQSNNTSLKPPREREDVVGRQARHFLNKFEKFVHS
jgi:hypothetical protein